MTNIYRSFCTYEEIISQADRLDQVLNRWGVMPEKLGECKHVLFTGCGSSLFLSRLVADTWNARLDRFCRVVPASEVLLRPGACFDRFKPTAVFGISRTGETTETIQALRVARDQYGLRIFPTTCYPDSVLGRMSERTLQFPEVQEDSVVMTRAFTAILAALLDWSGLGKEVRKLPAMISHSLDTNHDRIARLAEQDYEQVIFLGTGPFHPIACEAALKLKEMTGLRADARQLFEFRHGHQATIDEGTLLWLFVGREDIPYLEGLLPPLLELGAKVLSVGASLPQSVQSDSSDSINLPWSGSVTEIEAAGVLHLIQLYAFFRAVRMGRNPDQPLHLNRVVKLTSGVRAAS